MTAGSESAAYDIVPYDPALKPQIAALQRHLWRGDVALNTAYFEWKYEQNPYVNAPLVHLAMHGGQVVGMRGMFGSQWEVGTPAQTVLIPAADDLVIAPAHRTRGLFARIMQAALEDAAARGYPCAVSLSPGPITLAGSLATGWRSAGLMRPVYREARTHTVARRLYEKLRGLPLRPRWTDAARLAAGSVEGNVFKSLDRQGTRRADGPGVSLERVPRISGMADLVRRLPRDGRLRHTRDERYLAWRFRNPLHEYRFLFTGGEHLDGYLVLKTDHTGRRREVAIVDWEGTSSAIRLELLRAAIEWGRFQNLVVWTSSLPRDTVAQLAAAGFVRLDHGPLGRHLPSLLVRAITKDDAPAEPTLGGLRLLDPASWDMRMLYSMAG